MHQMVDYPIFKELVAISLPLSNIFLDPNNPRFVTMDWEDVPNDKISDEVVQNKVMSTLENEFNIESLVMNMEINGFLPIDRVIVKKVSNDNYVVLEGNRRICAAKVLKRKAEHGESVTAEVLESIEEIPCLTYTGSNSEASWIFQGLRHIMGIQEWSAYNKARLIVTLMEEEDLKLTEVGKRFGLTAFGAGQWVRAYYAFKQAKETSDYTKEVDEKIFPYFQEVFNRSNGSLRDWMKWNDKENKFEDELNFNEFLSWLYPRSSEDEEGAVSNSTGEWSNRAIKRSIDLRNVSYLISKSQKEFELFRSEKDLEKAYTQALQKSYEEEAKKTANPSEELFDSLDVSIKNLENVPFRILKDGLLRGKLFEKLEAIKSLIKELES